MMEEITIRIDYALKVRLLEELKLMNQFGGGWTLEEAIPRILRVEMDRIELQRLREKKISQQ